MRPRRYPFRFPAGATPSLGVILHGRDPRTGQVARLPISGVTVQWQITWPDGAETLTSASGLRVDPRTGATFYPLTDDRMVQIRAGQPISYSISLVMSDGFVYPFLVGDIGVE